jgi:predicted outer membrane protein
MSHRSTTQLRTALTLCTAAALSIATSGCMTMGVMGMSPEMQQHQMAMHAFSMATHMGEIEEAQLALSKSQNASVREFAQRMVTEHTAAMQRAHQMMTKMGMTMEGDAAMSAGGDMSMDMQRMRTMLMNHPHSRPVMEGHMQAMQMLRGLEGTQFDHAYLQRQVAAHSYALENMDRMMSNMGMMTDDAMAGSMAGGAGMDHGNMNMDLPATAEGVMMLHRIERQMVAAHLQMAQQRMQSMGSM